MVKFEHSFRVALDSAEFRTAARNILIFDYFHPDEQVAFCALLGMPVPKESDLKKLQDDVQSQAAQTKGRGTRFRLDIVAAYGYRCCLTQYRVTTVAGAAIVDAAHIHQFAKSRNDNPNNGIALCKNAHWLFDNGLWTIDKDYKIIVAKEAFDEESPNQQPLGYFHGKQILLPKNKAYWPDLKHLAWHRSKKFVGQ